MRRGSFAVSAAARNRIAIPNPGFSRLGLNTARIAVIAAWAPARDASALRSIFMKVSPGRARMVRVMSPGAVAPSVPASGRAARAAGTLFPAAGVAARVATTTLADIPSSRARPAGMESPATMMIATPTATGNRTRRRFGLFRPGDTGR